MPRQSLKGIEIMLLHPPLFLFSLSHKMRKILEGFHFDLNFAGETLKPKASDLTTQLKVFSHFVAPGN